MKKTWWGEWQSFQRLLGVHSFTLLCCTLSSDQFHPPLGCPSAPACQCWENHSQALEVTQCYWSLIKSFPQCSPSEMGLTAGLSLLVQKKSFTKVTRTTIMPILIPLPPLFFLGGGGRKEGVIYIVHLFFSFYRLFHKGRISLFSSWL